MFEQTPTGYQATAETVAWWTARDTCPACQTPTSPWETSPERQLHYYICRCEESCGGSAVTWTRKI